MESEKFLPIQIQMSWTEYQRLPRDPAWRYEYTDSTLTMTVRPRYRHCRLKFSNTSESLQNPAPHPQNHLDIDFVPWDSVLLTDFSPAFLSAFERVSPFSSLHPEHKPTVVQQALSNSLSGLAGQIAGPASFAVISPHHKTPVGGVLITLVPDADFGDFTDERWEEQPPDDAFTKHWGKPHLSWLFVQRDFQRQAIASQLFAKALATLTAAGYDEIFSTVLEGNHSSTLWHWQTGFQLLPAIRHRIIKN